MSDCLGTVKKIACGFVKSILIKRKKHTALLLACAAVAAAALVHPWGARSVLYAHAATIQTGDNAEIRSLLSDNSKDALLAYADIGQPAAASGEGPRESNGEENMEKGLYAMVGDSPIREMVPFIAKRDSRVAAFLVGIAKKESSFGFDSPSKDGTTCYNYWGYKGSAGRGTGMGYACFASAQEAVQVVGDRLDVLVEKKRDTPARMVDTWKCGISCAGDPGAPSWVSTVALYFDKIVNQNV